MNEPSFISASRCNVRKKRKEKKEKLLMEKKHEKHM